MKKTLLLFIVLLFIFSCKQKDKKFDDIEFMAYIISECSPCDHFLLEHPIISCRYYTLTDTSGKTKLVVQNLNIKNDIKYYDFAIDKKIINDLADSLLKLKSYNYLIKPRVCFYDGPTLKIRLNKNNESKTVHFRTSNYNEALIYTNFFHYIDSLIENNKLTVTKDTFNLLKRRSDFINWTFKMDTLIRPLPKISIDEDIFDEPIKKKHHHNQPKKH